MPDHPDDADALASVAAGLVEGLDALYERYAAVCFGLAQSVLAADGPAERVVLDAYLALWRQAASLSAQGASVCSWLLQRTHEDAVGRVRAARRGGAAVRPDPAVAVSRAGDAVRQALAPLSRSQRDAVAMAFWGGWTQREVAVLTGTPLSTVRADMHDGVRGVARSLGRLSSVD